MEQKETPVQNHEEPAVALYQSPDIETLPDRDDDNASDFLAFVRPSFWD